jgi:hypothetical protein
MDCILIVAIPFAVLGLGVAAATLWVWWSEKDWD